MEGSEEAVRKVEEESWYIGQDGIKEIGVEGRVKENVKEDEALS